MHTTFLNVLRLSAFSLISVGVGCQKPPVLELTVTQGEIHAPSEARGNGSKNRRDAGTNRMSPKSTTDLQAELAAIDDEMAFLETACDSYLTATNAVSDALLDEPLVQRASRELRAEVRVRLDPSDERTARDVVKDFDVWLEGRVTAEVQSCNCGKS